MGEKKKKEREAARLGAAPRNSRVSGGSGHTSAGGAPPLPRPPPSVPTAPRGRRRDRPRGTHLPHGSRSPVPAGGLPRPASAQPAARRRQRPALSEGRGAARPAALRARARPPPPTAPAPGGPEPTAVRPHTAITRGAAATTPGPRARRPLPSSPPSLPASLPPSRGRYGSSPLSLPRPLPDLGMVRRSPDPLLWCGSCGAGCCRANHTSSSFSVPSKKCAPFSFMVRQLGNQQPQKLTATPPPPPGSRSVSGGLHLLGLLWLFFFFQY